MAQLRRPKPWATRGHRDENREEPALLSPAEFSHRQHRGSPYATSPHRFLTLPRFSVFCSCPSRGPLAPIPCHSPTHCPQLRWHCLRFEGQLAALAPLPPHASLAGGPRAWRSAGRGWRPPAVPGSGHRPRGRLALLWPPAAGEGPTSAGRWSTRGLTGLSLRFRRSVPAQKQLKNSPWRAADLARPRPSRGFRGCVRPHRAPRSGRAGACPGTSGDCRKGRDSRYGGIRHFRHRANRSPRQRSPLGGCGPPPSPDPVHLASAKRRLAAIQQSGPRVGGWATAPACTLV